MVELVPAANWRRRPAEPVGVLGHRGGRRGPGENTLEAFSAALSAGADGVELDVRLTADGVPVVHHDAAVEGVGPLHELRRHQLPSWLPTLADALDTCAEALVDVEIKNSPGEQSHDPAERLAATVADMVHGALTSSRGPRAVMVSSFSPASLRMALATRPTTNVGLLVHPAFDAGSALDEAQSMGAGCVLPYFAAVDAELVDTVHAAGLAVAVWTVNETADLLRMQSAGVDFVVTDDVAGALAALRRA